MIYAISVKQPEDVRFIKFGKARNPRSRLKELQTGNPLKLQIYAEADWPDEYEGLLHRRFAKKRVSGEWFTVDDEVNDFMNLMVYQPEKARDGLSNVALRTDGVVRVPEMSSEVQRSELPVSVPSEGRTANRRGN
jgi:hypothetical protein